MYNHAMFRELNHLRTSHLIKPPLVINLVLGVPVVGGVGANPHDLLTLSTYVPTEPRLVSVTAHDDINMRLIALALALDLDIRVGLEDTPVPSKGQPHCSNAELVERAARLVRSVGYEVATPDETREALALRHHISSQPVTAS
jgi:3-keto-5-aminohexanoate cleavage enzyme